MKFYHLILFTFLFIVVESLCQRKELTIDDIYSNSGLYGKSLKGVHWFDDGNKFSFLKFDGEKNSTAIFQYEVNTGEENVLLTEKELNEIEPELNITHYEWSPDEKYILFTDLLTARDVKTGGSFYLYDLRKQQIVLKVESEDEQVNIQFSPDGKNIGFVRGNNLFVVDIETGKEKQLTFDGSDEILNGVFDWVYEEEFSIIKAWEWSPDSRSIAFWRLDQSNVPRVYITKWDSLYFEPVVQHYPKAGGNNSVVKIGVVNVNTSNTTWMDIGSDTDIYIPRIKYAQNPNTLSIQRLNRLQNKLELLFADTKTGKAKIILTETDTAWVDVWDDLRFLNDGKHFIWSSERDGYHHLYLYDMSGKMINQITKGEWEIDKLISIDEENQIIYYTSPGQSPIYRNLYSINFNGTEKERITEEKGDHSIEMSPNSRYFIDKYSNANTLPSTILYKADGEEIKKLIVADMSAFEEYELSPVEFIKFMTSDGMELNAAMIKPADFDSSKEYPVLIYNYSGPGSQVVLDKWEVPLWHRMLSQKGYIIFWLDNRGTSCRGKSFKNVMYKNLGYWEVNDMIEAAKYLSSTGYVDPERIGIYGSSYGGYIAALAILKGAEYFKTAISVAPVIHWKFYDTIYTERYMQTPELNPKGYEDSSPLSYVNKFKGKLLLIHGTSDDNVHFQNSIAFIEALTKANKQFDLMVYPGVLHGGFGKHYLNLIINFILKNL